MITIIPDMELDAILTMRQAGKLSLPPELCMMSGRRANEFQRWILRYKLLECADHPLLGVVSDSKIFAAMAEVINQRSDYIDRLQHLLAGEDVSAIPFADLRPATAPNPVLAGEARQSAVDPVGSATSSYGAAGAVHGPTDPCIGPKARHGPEGPSARTKHETVAGPKGRNLEGDFE